jgi:voltage-gated potassium channel
VKNFPPEKRVTWYPIDMAKRTKTLSKRLFALFYIPKTKGFYFVSDVLAIATIASVISIILETVPSLDKFSYIFLTVEYVTLFLFTLEYIGRIIANRGNVRAYIFSFFGIIDLLAILPSFIGLTNLTFLKTARVLRIIRMLRMARLAKLANVHKPHGPETDEELGVHKLTVEIYFVVLLSGVLFSGTLLYLVEGSLYTSIPDGMFWALKATMRIPPSKLPETLLGEGVMVLTYFFGLLLFGLLLAVVGNMFKKLLLGED